MREQGGALSEQSALSERSFPSGSVQWSLSISPGSSCVVDAVSAETVNV